MYSNPGGRSAPLPRGVSSKGENPAVLVGLQASGGDEILRFQDRPRNPEPAGPVSVLGFELHPVFFLQIVKVGDLNL